MKEWIKKNQKVLIFILYSIISIALICFHENWRDEAQAWLIARDCNIIELFGMMKYEGHFILWYLILMPFAKLGFPYFTINIISWIFTIAAVWLILDKAPFKFYKRVLLIFTFPLIYLFPVLSRCYCLIPLAICSMSIFYKDRKEKPFRYILSIILLANTHIIMMGMVGVVLIDFFIESCKEFKNISHKDKKKRIYSLIITIVLLIITILPLVGCLGANKDIGNNNSFINKIVLAVFCYPFILLMEIFNYFMSNIFMISLAFILTCIVLFYEIKNHPIIYLKIFLCTMWQCIIYSFIFSSSLQRASTIIFILLYYKWINTYKNNNKIKEKKIQNNQMIQNIQEISWIVLAILNILVGVLYVSIYEIPFKCSYSYEIGNYINEHLNDRSIILNGSRGEYTSSIIPHIKKDIRFYQITGNRYFSYAILDEKNKSDLDYSDFQNLSSAFDNEQELYYIYCNDKSDVGNKAIEYKEKEIIEMLIDKGVLKELYFTEDKSLYKENYILYEVNLDKISLY